VCIRYRGNVSKEPLPSKDRGICTEPLPSNGKGNFTEQLLSNNRGIYRHTEQRDLISRLKSDLSRFALFVAFLFEGNDYPGK
jgi:hypothetical protein